jgi:UDP-N-acetylglucosamine--N-acetylmuramyl-(pentapeptide) pyrophosphoryl-undecaprenol N-acetylglucosamine transferase
MRIVLTSGGTGGHLFPLVVVAEKIKEKQPDAELLFIGPKGLLEESLMKKNNIPVNKILVGKFRRYFSFSNFLDIFKIPIGIIQSLWYLLKYMPDVIFSKGSYASLPVVIAGWIYQIPIMVHESDSVPGKTNEILGKLANRVAISYPQAESFFTPEKAVLTGNPLRQDINQGNAQKIREKFSLTELKKIIFVWGGSQGSDLINSKIINILPKLLKNYQVIHQTGKKNFEKVKARAGEMGIKEGRGGYFAIPFIEDDLKDILAAADLVISRAGANSLSEIAANKKPAIIIPLKNSANDHQRKNAYFLSQIGGCLVLEEENLGESLLLSRINEIMESQELQEKFSKNIQKFYHSDAAEKITAGILEMAG